MRNGFNSSAIGFPGTRNYIFIVAVSFFGLCITTSSNTFGQQSVSSITRKRFQKAKKFVESTRDLSFQNEISMKTGDPTAYGDKLVSRLKTYFDLKPALLDGVLKKMYLIPAFIDLPSMVEILSLSSVSAFYWKDTIHLINDDKPSTQLLVHELTHALEDQHFQFASLAERNKGQFDRQLALSALVEGSGILVERAYRNRSISSIQNFRSLHRRSWMTGTSMVSRLLKQIQLFPYRMGAAFVATIRKQKGWEGVNHVFRNPPRTTEQILHPEKYTSNERPDRILFSSLVRSLSEQAHRKRLEMTIGEAGTAMIFSTLHPEPDKNYRKLLKGATGWNGDHVLYFTTWKESGNGTGNDFAIWITGWDTVKDRNEALRIFRTVLNHQSKGDEEQQDQFFQYGIPSNQINGILYRDRLIITVWQLPESLKETIKNQFPKLKMKSRIDESKAESSDQPH